MTSLPRSQVIRGNPDGREAIRNSPTLRAERGRMDKELRKEVEREWKKLGVPGNVLDTWQPRQNCWSHTPQLTPGGSIAKPAGTFMPNLPGNPDHAMRKARIGVLPWPPAETCRCKACRERDWPLWRFNTESPEETERSQLIEIAAAGSVAVQPSNGTAKIQVGSKCPQCDYTVHARAAKRPGTALAAHVRAKHQLVAA
jgi:hypothetical protein